MPSINIVRISDYIVCETLLKVGLECEWHWVAINRARKLTNPSTK
jgi:hypothetical protein